jgi:hypothetical protein
MMRVRDRGWVTGLLVGALSVPILAAGVRAQEAPKLPEQMKKLQSLVGTYEGTGSMTMEGKTITAKFKHVNSLISDGWGLRCVETIESPDMPTYHSENLIGFDPWTNELAILTIDNIGSVHNHRGKMKGEGHCLLVYEGPMEGKKLREEVDFSYKADGHDYRIKAHETLDGRPYSDAEVSMVRR